MSINVQLTAVGISNPIPIDLAKFRGGVGIVVTIPAGTQATYTVEITGDDPTNGFTFWNPHDVLIAKTVSANSNIAYPVTGIRLNVATMAGAGPINMSVVQVRG